MRIEDVEEIAEIDNAAFDKCAEELESNGYSLLPLSALRSRRPKEIPTLVTQAFTTARRALDATLNAIDTSPVLIDPETDSGSWTGFHNATSINGRYNQHREGFVFSNGEMFDVELGADLTANFRDDMNNLFRIMHDDVATSVLHAIERRLKIPHFYFQHEFGPTHNSSQWHLKRYVVDDQQNFSSDSSEPILKEKQQNRDEIFLPAHTDPSLISVVILDQVGRRKGGMGLEVFHPRITRTNTGGGGGEWREISEHGHDVAVIFMGSVFSYLTKGQLFPAAKHRVVGWSSSCNETSRSLVQNCIESRMAATLFVRPNGDAIMKPLPSPYLNNDDDALQKHTFFRVWNARVAKNYMKIKQQPPRQNNS